MSTTVLFLNPGEIRQVQRRKLAPSPSRFLKLGREIHRVANVVKDEWNSFSPEQREMLKELAYDLVEPTPIFRGVLPKLWAISYMFLIKMTGQEEPFYFCLNALDNLVDNILDAVERENPTYQQELLDTLEELNLNSDPGECINGADRKQWLRGLSNQAFTEI